MTPDRDLESATLAVFSEVKRIVGGRLPGGVRECDTYLPKHAYDGPIPPEEMRSLVFQAERQFRDGRRHRINGRSDGPFVAGSARAPPEALPADLQQDVDSGLRWLIVCASDGAGVGDEMSIPAQANQVLVGGKTFLHVH